jgi:hypothetical protein
MVRQQRLTRDVIIQTLVDALEPRSYIHAFWEGGAAAFNRIDEWSDIDLYLVVDDEKIDEAFLAVETALQSLSSIKQKYRMPKNPRLDLSQAFYRLENASEYLIIDLVMFNPSSSEKFIEPNVHGNVVFYFNKSNKIRPLPLDKDALTVKLQERLRRLRAKFDMFNNFVQKEINRGNTLEAMDLYHALTLATLVEILRIKYEPVHHDFKTRYIHYELPSDAVGNLEHLFFVKDKIDLQRKYHKASKWIREVFSEIDQKDMEQLAGTS